MDIDFAHFFEDGTKVKIPAKKNLQKKYDFRIGLTPFLFFFQNLPHWEEVEVPGHQLLSAAHPHWQISHQYCSPV